LTRLAIKGLQASVKMEGQYDSYWIHSIAKRGKVGRLQIDRASKTCAASYVIIVNIYAGIKAKEEGEKSIVA
jgi:hypothetical protein